MTRPHDGRCHPHIPPRHPDVAMTSASPGGSLSFQALAPAPPLGTPHAPADPHEPLPALSLSSSRSPPPRTPRWTPGTLPLDAGAARGALRTGHAVRGRVHAGRSPGPDDDADDDAMTTTTTPTLEDGDGSSRDECPDAFDDDDSSTPSVAPAPLQLDVDGKGQMLAGMELRGLQHLTARTGAHAQAPPAAGPAHAWSRPPKAAPPGAHGRSSRHHAHAEAQRRPRPRCGGHPRGAPCRLLRLVPGAAGRDVAGAARGPVPPQRHGRPLRRHEDNDEEVVATLRISDDSLSVTATPTPPLCPPLRPPREWLARLDARGELQPGIVAGLTAALERTLEELAR